MKRISIAAIAVLMLAAGHVFAQVSEVKVKDGDKFSYELKTVSATTQSIQGQDMVIDVMADGTLQLAAKSTAKKPADRIEWTLSMPRMNLKTKGDAIPGGGMDTVINAEPMDFATDRMGNPIGKPELDETLAMALGGVRGAIVGQWFLPAMVKSMKVGDSREVTEIDTVAHPMMEGADMYITRTTVYHYDGPVDTLKTKAARIRAEVTSLSIEGAGEMMGANVNITGDGAMNTTAYYSMKDGMLMNSAMKGEMSMRLAVTGQMEMMIPITQNLSCTLSRK